MIVLCAPAVVLAFLVREMTRFASLLEPFAAIPLMVSKPAIGAVRSLRNADAASWPS